MEKRFFGLQGAGKGWAVSDLYRSFPRITVICRDRRCAEDLIDDLTFFLRSSNVLHFPAWDTLPFEPVSPQSYVTAERLRTLAHVGAGNSHIAVVSADALLQRTLPPSIVTSLSFELKTGQHIGRDELIGWFDKAGFQQVSLVEDTGELAVRGGVIDFAPAADGTGVRLELLDDRIQKIKTFDFDSQRSQSELDAVLVTPVREGVTLHATLELQAMLPSAIARVKQQGRMLEVSPREIARTVHTLQNDLVLPGIELLTAIALAPLASYFDYLPHDELIVVNDEIGIDRGLDQLWEHIEEREARVRDQHLLLPMKEQLYLSTEEFKARSRNFSRCYLDSLEVLQQEHEQSEVINVKSSSNIELATRLKTKIGTGEALKPLADAVRHWRQAGFHIAFVAGSPTRATRLQHLLLDISIDARLLDASGHEWASAPRRAPIVILQGHLSAGVQLPSEKLVLISENEIFAERSYRKNARPAKSVKRLLSAVAQLKEGDYVVHTDYGVGVYQGLKHLTVEGTEGDFLQIDYADSRLYLPVVNISKIQKFVAAEGQEPALDRLGSNRWAKTKLKVKQSLIELAGDLIKLYAARTVVKGWRYEPAGAEDERFADGFPFEETPDQMAAIESSLNDMASDRPMDRLICGDVGFGKTEVALRAAFKCTQHARQAALLAPTTILVEQHKETFLERFKGYPVKIAAVSRFYKPADNRATLAALARGEIDIIIGTHRLLQRDVQFADLGLAIVDEEHRFGVKQKEKLKQIKKQVDVLTLTATPIPRTLHMALLNIRDISVISTPPHDRRAIRTYISTYSDGIVRDAILRELQRGGQCFFVHNRIESIGLLTHKLRELVPEARFAFGHGQMTETELEEIMHRFQKREIDVLVSTTIIESGLDLPNANTILIDRADTFGLAQLYQLRGRVGRSSRQAYAYFIVPEARKLGTDAQKRLKVLQSLDDLGLGFNLAIRDMEIRGAGNLLGKEQSGNVLAVGFELYTKILKEAVLHLKGEELDLEEEVDPEVKISIDAYIPDSYIPDISERLVLYQRLAMLPSDEEAFAMADEIADRFGPMPPEVYQFLEIMRFRSFLRRSGVVRAEFTQGKTVLLFSPRAPISGPKIVELVRREPGKYKFSKNFSLTLYTDPEVKPRPQLLFDPVRALIERVQMERPGRTRAVPHMPPGFGGRSGESVA